MLLLYAVFNFLLSYVRLINGLIMARWICIPCGFTAKDAERETSILLNRLFICRRRVDLVFVASFIGFQSRNTYAAWSYIVIGRTVILWIFRWSRINRSHTSYIQSSGIFSMLTLYCRGLATGSVCAVTRQKAVVKNPRSLYALSLSPLRMRWNSIFTV